MTDSPDVTRLDPCSDGTVLAKDCTQPVQKTPVFHTDTKTPVLYMLNRSTIRVAEHTMHIAAYVRVSTDDQNEDRQMRAIRTKYAESEQDTEIDWFCDLGESGASTSRREYQRLREHVEEYDVVVAHELDRLGRSLADLAGFIEDLRQKGIDIDLVNQPIGTVGEDDWMAEMMLNMMMVFADAERKMIRSRVQEGINAAIADGKRVGRPPFGYTVEDGFLQQIPAEYVRAQAFIREVRKGREKQATAAFFEIPDSAVQSILARAEANYDVPFDNEQWRLNRAKVAADEKDLPPLDARDARHPPSVSRPE
jgi:DNA invertase Pin-like site-specific DNA recombinase